MDGERARCAVLDMRVRAAALTVVMLLVLLVTSCGTDTATSSEGQEPRGRDDPCRSDVGVDQGPQLTRPAEQDARLIEGLVDWRNSSLQGVTFDAQENRLVVVVDPSSSETEQCETRAAVRRIVGSGSRSDLTFRSGCFANSELADVRDGLLSDNWLGSANAGFTVAYDADDGHIRLAVEPAGRQMAGVVARQYRPIVRPPL